MNYQDARNCFIENCRLIGPDPMKDPLNWNLNNGLQQLAQALMNDLHAIQSSISGLEHKLHHLENRIASLR
jgi:hypothetical protein